MQITIVAISSRVAKRLVWRVMVIIIRFVLWFD